MRCPPGCVQCELSLSERFLRPAWPRPWEHRGGRSVRPTPFPADCDAGRGGEGFCQAAVPILSHHSLTLRPWVPLERLARFLTQFALEGWACPTCLEGDGLRGAHSQVGSSHGPSPWPLGVCFSAPKMAVDRAIKVATGYSVLCGSCISLHTSAVCSHHLSDAHACFAPRPCIWHITPAFSSLHFAGGISPALASPCLVWPLKFSRHPASGEYLGYGRLTDRQDRGLTSKSMGFFLS